MKQQPSYYSIIPAPIRYSKEINDFEKILYSDITALTNKNGYCTATNNYFAELFGKSKETISRAISKFEKLGFLKVVIVYKNETKEILERQLYLVLNTKIAKRIDENINTPIDENINTPIDENINTPIDENINTPIDENINRNNININNIKTLSPLPSLTKKQINPKREEKREDKKDFYKFIETTREQYKGSGINNFYPTLCIFNSKEIKVASNKFLYFAGSTDYLSASQANEVWEYLFKNLGALMPITTQRATS